MRILGIETSCDDTCAAVVQDGAVVSSVVSSQHDFHASYGGVVPEVASRQHSRLIIPVVREAMVGAGLAWADLEAVAVTTAPGLIGALLVGVAVAKGISVSCGIPLIPVNHLLAHVHSVFMSTPDVEVPHVSLLVSGGHTILFLVTATGEARVMGSTLDDAAGEALDKAAHLLGLGYPGGPAIDRIGACGDPRALSFPRPLADRRGLDLSFSGLKTALAVHVQRHGHPVTEQDVADLAASYLEAVVDVLVRKTVQAAQLTGVNAVSLVGGVAANRRLREVMGTRCHSAGLGLILPPSSWCTDNAAMVAGLGELEARRRGPGPAHLDASASVQMPRWSERGQDACIVSRVDT